MSKSSHSLEFRAMVAQEYIDGIGFYNYLAEYYHVGRSTIHKRVDSFRVHGIKAFIVLPGNKAIQGTLDILCRSCFEWTRKLCRD